MKKITILLIFLITSCSKISFFNNDKFSIKSSDINKNSIIKEEQVFKGFGCDGKNISPQISWQNAPKDTRSFALTVYDPDAPTGSGWWHWVVVNIPANYNELPRDFGAKNKFVIDNNINQIKNDYGNFSYGGPCPPKGNKKHRYIFTLHALKTDKIVIDKNSSPALVGFMINYNTIAKASFKAYYSR